MARGLIRCLRLVVILVLATQLAGCFSRTGDLGRRHSGPLSQNALPMFGTANARARGEPASDYNHTDNEKVLARRATHLQNPPHARDWYGRVVTEMETTRYIRGFGRAHPPERYYDYLRTDKFRSSESRYERLRSDMLADAELVIPFYEAARLVRIDDRERILATRRHPDLTDEEYSNSKGRVYENNLTIAQVGDALNYRLSAYRFAIDRMEIETPSDQIWSMNRAWRYLAASIDAGKAKLDNTITSGPQEIAHRRSRIYTGPFDEEPVSQK